MALTPELTPMLERASMEDKGHGPPPFPSHVFLKDSEVVGAMSLFAPTVCFWAHTSRLRKREALFMAQHGRELALARQPNFLVACCLDSPFYPVMPALGFRRLANADYFDVAR